MIEFRQVTKKYGKKVALNDFSIQIPSGQIIGIIGHNGAGKSTALKSLVSIIDPSEGEIWVDGLELSANRLAIKSKIGYVSDSPDLFLKLTAFEVWELVASAFQMGDEDFQKRLDWLLTLFNFKEEQFGVIESFSHGMRQKVFVIAALLSNPDIWILDEPMTGLDPQSAFELKGLMRNHAKEGNTVIFSTHVLEVAETLCDQIAILKKGQLIFFGTVEELKAANPQASLESIYLEMTGLKNPDVIEQLDLENKEETNLTPMEGMVGDSLVKEVDEHEN
ncbi:ABC transporter ATP-binding protein [Granulicatella seriolae]|uniref:ABC transporter ATP-binding protein n=1 Tax=Granulicatella seriolae TaxID=2967226 RepID=A0ABT1WL65_9LACT|nr:ABC transporter ATP-binding protein [Granulicatella seriolae]